MLKNMIENVEKYSYGRITLIQRDLVERKKHKEDDSEPPITRRGAEMAVVGISCCLPSETDDLEPFRNLLRTRGFSHGGLLLVQGSGGVGKSQILVALVRLHYCLQTRHASHSPPEDASTSKGLSEKIRNACVEEYNQFLADGIQASCPIVIRRHMRDTEVVIYRKEANARRDKQRREKKASYYDPSADDDDASENKDNEDDNEDDADPILEQLAQMLVTDKKLQQPLVNTTGFQADKRLRLAENHPFRQQVGVSLFHYLLLAGIDTVWLFEQHRSNSCINDLINFTLPRGRMRVAPGIEYRPISQLALKTTRNLFKTTSRVVFMDIEEYRIQTADLFNELRDEYECTFFCTRNPYGICNTVGDLDTAYQMTPNDPHENNDDDRSQHDNVDFYNKRAASLRRINMKAQTVERALIMTDEGPYL
ncbi:hypothetical protein COCC4DRAFT_43144 [Bipolaris maydis ATCC 48331]|uniref:Uncharacterized protein n=1 Tax=Cochliobolus heterostrophus (strain C4 / ATCC 48331 / race T) TaxID=665024 RepID=N4WNT0_COCH4|nr:uncharacterized protein COCC4DRAFT_43144 [Bipolaris maydis ATCC 48331]ENI02084.1 hypothetical protein COCC4DRAFT_43144 [Bipolaris maydis ATCC 48331]KAJ5028151.1 hypothetical protein J3E73DRAFT_368573 [Bipolaris maydis]KAJ6265585.1 hypothetical protein PSV08DRAFT_357238 [Bipolaris maydis]KAJ6283457.1 hypothetical protein J3E71DRAFT_360970 [Bipolaris maydis]